jgi:hypothetical protein
MSAVTVPAVDGRRPRMRAGSIMLVVVYGVLAVAGLVGTWTFNLAFTPTAEIPSYLDGWFANAAASSAAVDVIVTALAACLFYVVTGWRLGRPMFLVGIVLVPLTFVVALAFTFPLFLALREIALSRGSGAPRSS